MGLSKCRGNKLPNHDWFYHVDADGAYQRVCRNDNCEAHEKNVNYPDSPEQWVGIKEAIDNDD